MRGLWPTCRVTAPSSDVAGAWSPKAGSRRAAGRASPHAPTEPTGSPCRAAPAAGSAPGPAHPAGSASGGPGARNPCCSQRPPQPAEPVKGLNEPQLEAHRAAWVPGARGWMPGPLGRPLSWRLGSTGPQRGAPVLGPEENPRPSSELQVGTEPGGERRPHHHHHLHELHQEPNWISGAPPSAWNKQQDEGGVRAKLDLDIFLKQ